MKWQFNSFAQTDLGLVREGNEDSAIYGANLIAVAVATRVTNMKQFNIISGDV